MKREEMQDKFLDYVENSLSESESRQISLALESDSELRKAFEAYKGVMAIEKSLAALGAEARAGFSVNVLSEIEDKKTGYFRRLFMDVVSKQRLIFGAAATLATVLLVVKASNIAPYDQVYERGQKSQPTSAVTAPVVPSESITAPKSLPAVVPAPVEKKIEYNDTRVTSDKGLAENKLDLLPAPKSKKESRSPVEYNDNAPLAKSRQYSVTGPADEAASAKQDGERVGAAVGGFAAQSEPLDQASNSRDHDFIYPTNDGGREGYVGYGENARVFTTQESSSTFGVDVDTASYSNVRRFLKEGQLPPKDSIRIEEFINYFDYSYPQQYEKPFTLSYEAGPSPLEKDRYLLKLGIKARNAKQETKPWNLVFLIDVSGSMMDENKLPLVKKSLKLLADKMRANDRIAIVTYAGSAGTVLESTGVNEKAKILNAIDSLIAGGSTNGSGGITAAYDLALKNKINEGVNRVVLATDGDFNVGLTSHEQLIKFIEEKRKSGITLTALGYGRGNVQDGIMEQLANKGNGNYFYIDSFQEARKVLETDLVGNMEVVAKDVKLQVEFNPQKVSSFRLIGYENRKLNREDFNNDAVDAGEIGTGHTVTAIYEIVLANSDLAKKMSDEYRYKQIPTVTSLSNESNAELAFLKIRYKEPDGSESKLLQYPIEAKDLRTNLDEESTDFKFAAAVSYFAHILRGSQFVGDYTLKDVQALAESARGDDRNGYRQELIEMIKNAQALQR